jgi:hypothetical protein
MSETSYVTDDSKVGQRYLVRRPDPDSLSLGVELLDVVTCNEYRKFPDGAAVILGTINGKRDEDFADENFALFEHELKEIPTVERLVVGKTYIVNNPDCLSDGSVEKGDIAVCISVPNSYFTYGKCEIRGKEDIGLVRLLPEEVEEVEMEPEPATPDDELSLIDEVNELRAYVAELEQQLNEAHRAHCETLYESLFDAIAAKGLEAQIEEYQRIIRERSEKNVDSVA